MRNSYFLFFPAKLSFGLIESYICVQQKVENDVPLHKKRSIKDQLTDRLTDGLTGVDEFCERDLKIIVENAQVLA